MIFIYFGMFSDELPLGLHWVMFIPTLRGQGDEEQAKYWLELADKYAIIGTYAQVKLLFRHLYHS